MLKNNIKITDITKTKKGFNALFTADGFLFSVDDLLLINEKITIGSCFSQQELDCIMKKSQTVKAVEKAYQLLSFRMHGAKELYNKLCKFYDPDCSLKAVEKMEELGLVDDYVFAQLKAEYLLNVKKASISHIKLKLQSLGIERDVIQQVLADFDDDAQQEELLYLLKGSYSQKLSKPEKVVQSLLRKGFKFRDIKQAFDTLGLSTRSDLREDYEEYVE